MGGMRPVECWTGADINREDRSDFEDKCATDT